MKAPEDIPIIFPVGHHACGKSEVSKYLIERYNFAIIETGAMVRGSYMRADPDKTRFCHIGDFVAKVEADNPTFFTDMVLTDMGKRVADDSPGGIIINGMRTLTHLRELQERTAGYPQAVIWIESPREMLKARWEMRQQRGLSDDEFDALLLFDSQLGLDQIRPIANTEVLNSGTIDMLRSGTEEALQGLGMISIRNYTQ